jgi:hypothetical protein
MGSIAAAAQAFFFCNFPRFSVFPASTPPCAIIVSNRCELAGLHCESMPRQGMACAVTKVTGVSHILNTNI